MKQVVGRWPDRWWLQPSFFPPSTGWIHWMTQNVSPPCNASVSHPKLRNRAIAFAVEFVEVDEIDRVNILQATLNGMQRAVGNLEPAPGLALIDGNRAPRLACEVKTVVGGDRLVASISAASILAKVYRDRLMLAMHDVYPEYGFDRHKGYPTAFHLERLKSLGPCAIHRRSFAPVRKVIEIGDGFDF